MFRFNRLIIIITLSLVCNLLLFPQDFELPYLTNIQINNDSLLTVSSGGLSDKEKPIVFDYDHNNLYFEVENGDSASVRFFLEGFDTEWSRWSNSGYKEYTNLPAGDYILRAGYMTKSEAGDIKLLSFRVLPPWYSSTPAILFYSTLFALLIYVFYSQMRLRFARTQYVLEQIINKRTEDLIIEKEKTDKLLANILPKNTASEIMEKGKAAKIKYNFVTVLFSDIQGFTKIAEETNPEVLIDELDKFFFYFDSVVERLGIEKIKTIGDAYMCAGGIPDKNRTNPVEVILAALEMQVYMKNLKETSEIEGMKFWDIRIGIHTGTVIAGVVGQKKLSYDIWGDTVNTASRMESSGEAGKINISGTTYEFVKDFFICEHRGKMPVKYKGELDMYFVHEIRPELQDNEGKPNRKFILKTQMIKLQDVEDAVIAIFEEEAPPNLYFHNAAFVRNVGSQAELLSMSEKLSDEEYIALKLAAVFLFTGYLADYDNPVEAAFRITDEKLSSYNFEKGQIEEVKRLIKNSFDDIIDTPADRILHDARYDYLGRVDYIKLTEKLYREESAYGKSGPKDEWVKRQKKLLLTHDFLTSTAKLLRSMTKEEQEKELSATFR